MLRILLVNAPAREVRDEPIIVPPLGLACLAAVAREAGHDVSIIDAFAESLNWKAFAERVAQSRYDVIGFTGMTPVFDTTKRAISICRPHADVTVLGGPHATAMRKSVLDDNPDLDYAIYGEGEETFLEFLSAVERGEVDSIIPGVITRDGTGSARQLRRNLDDLPFPARDLLPNRNYRYPLSGSARITTIITSRGCPYDCVFCDKNVFGSQWRARSADNVLAEIDEVVSKYDIQSIIFYDDLFTLKKERLREICEGLIERKYDISWKAEGRVDLVDEEMLVLMKRAGCDTLAYGVESANQAGLDYLGKRTTPDMAREAFRKTRAAGIRTTAYFILGIPVETYDDALNSVRFAIDIKADYAQFSVLSPLPGTRLYQEAKEKGWYHEIAAHNISDKDLLRPVLLSDNWDEEKLISIVREAHRKFYLRPSYMIRSLLRVRSLGVLRKMIALGFDMVKYAFGFKR